MPANTCRVPSSPTSSVSFSSLSAPSTCSASTIRATRKSIFAKSSMEIVRGAAASTALRVRAERLGLRVRSLSVFPFDLEQRVELLRFDAGHEVLVGFDACRAAACRHRSSISGPRVEEVARRCAASRGSTGLR